MFHRKFPHQRFHRQRPAWWPENAAWPPPQRFRHNPFFRRVGCLILAFNLFGICLASAVLVLALDVLGITRSSFDIVRWVIPLGVLGLFFLVIVVGAAGWVVRRISAPLDDLLAAADRLAEGDYAARVPEKGYREVRSLSRAFNNMASRLSTIDEQRRRLLSDITHELRSPITVLKGNLEGMLDGVYPANEANLRSLLEETNLLRRLVDDLRILALAESGALQLQKEQTDLATLAGETLAAFQPQAEAAGVSLALEAAGHLPEVSLDPGRIRQVLTNLLTNALRYTPAGGRITLRYRQSDGRAELEVQDTGPGIAAEDLPHIFERFYKSADSGGMGLGLAIAKHLVEAHGGAITALSAPGQGTIIRVSLPIGSS